MTFAAEADAEAIASERMAPMIRCFLNKAKEGKHIDPRFDQYIDKFEILLETKEATADRKRKNKLKRDLARLSWNMS